MVLGVIFATIIPVTPRTAWFLTPEERIVAVQRVAQEHAVRQNDRYST
jgi:ACS family allantoate permease-like MFS transporter